MAAIGPLTYTYTDAEDQRVYDHVLKDNAERVAFIWFVNHIFDRASGDFGQPPQGTRIASLWQKRKFYWIKKARKEDNLPQAQQPALAPHPASSSRKRKQSEREASNGNAGSETARSSKRRSREASKSQLDENNENQESRTPKKTPEEIPKSNSASTNSPAIRKTSDDDSSSPSIESANNSSDSGELSPIYVFRNDPSGGRMLSPTAGQRKFVAQHLGGKWKFARTLHQRAIGPKYPGIQPSLFPKSLWLFVLLDEYNNIIDEIVVKCLYMKARRPADPSILDEIKFCKILASTSCSHILQYRGNGQREPQWRSISGAEVVQYFTLCIYSQYASGGDTKGLLDVYLRDEDPKPLPEHFVWYFLEGVVEAMLTLKTGSCEDPLDKPLTVYGGDFGPSAFSENSTDGKLKKKEWRPIIHCDIKGENIFLGDNDETYPTYRRPLLADFDLSQYLTKDAVRFRGTQGWMAPEKYYDPIHEEIPSHGWDINEKTDVWALGLLALKLLLVTNKDFDLTKILQAVQETWSLTNFANHARSIRPEVEEFPGQYSVLLIQTIFSMLAYQQKDRPSLETLQAKIRERLEYLDDLHSYKMTEESVDSEDEITFPSNHDFLGKGFQFSPLKKARLASPASGEELKGLTERLDRLLSDWDNLRGKLPGSSVLQRTFESFEETVFETFLRSLESTSVEYHACLRAMAILRKRIAPDAPQDQIYGSFNHGPSWRTLAAHHSAFDPDLKDWALSRIWDLLADYLSTHDANVSITALQNAVDWGRTLLKIGGRQIRQHRVKKPSVFHKAVEDLLKHEPSGVWPEDGFTTQQS